MKQKEYSVTFTMHDCKIEDFKVFFDTDRQTKITEWL